MGVVKDTPDDVPSIPEDDTFDQDKCNSCPPSYDLSRGDGAFNSRLSLARTNSTNSMTSLRATGNSFMKPGIHRSASSTSFQMQDKLKAGRSLSRTMSASSFTTPAGERHMSRSMSSASFFFAGEEFDGKCHC